MTVADDRPRVLIVDDDRNLRQTLAEVLSARGQYRVEIATDGYEALIKVAAFRPDLMVLDVRMPGLDGGEVCRKVKEDPSISGTRVLAITGHADGSTQGELRRAGVDGCLQKPFTIAALQGEVARLVRAVPRQAPASQTLPIV